MKSVCCTHKPLLPFNTEGKRIIIVFLDFNVSSTTQGHLRMKEEKSNNGNKKRNNWQQKLDSSFELVLLSLTRVRVLVRQIRRFDGLLSGLKYPFDKGR